MTRLGVLIDHRERPRAPLQGSRRDKKKKAPEGEEGQAEEEGVGGRQRRLDRSAEESEEEEDSTPARRPAVAVQLLRGIRVRGRRQTRRRDRFCLRAVQGCALTENERGSPILCAAAFEDGSTLLKQLPGESPFTKAFAKDAQPYSLIYPPGEVLSATKASKLTAKFAFVLKALERR